MAETRIVTPGDIAAALPELWSPRVIGEIDDNYVKVARVCGEFVWHSHENEDELFFVLKGNLRIELDDGVIDLREGDLCIVPKGIRHRPIAAKECHILLVERKSTLHTGGTHSSMTRSVAEQLAEG